MRIEPDTNLLPADDLLQAAYQQLGFDHGALRETSTTPSDVDPKEWIDRGDWNSLAKQIGAESLFFVKNDPVVVFAKAEDANKDNLRDLYERIWCMSRPQLLFLATPGQLSAYDLTKSPPKPGEDIQDKDKNGARLIAVAESVAEVQSKLGEYHRERVETGAVFGDSRFRNSLNRADHALIRDLKTVRRQLADVSGAEGPTLGYLHSLIGRAIFIRYLEDRKIIPSKYFKEVAKQNDKWAAIVDQPTEATAMEARLRELRFLRVLRDKDFTYALFDQLAKDFNGDTFPVSDEERDFIQQEHLDKLMGFLTGSPSEQQELFFFAYRFDVIPIELISTIYEEFYRERTDNGTDQGSYYTPPALVEFVLTHTLTPEVLEGRPRVLDPACGSGIFLVESFRRMVRYQQTKQSMRVRRDQLLKILREQIVGIDINEEAVSVAAFSLYLAFLHYQEPREINKNRTLPHLKWQPENRRRGQTTRGAQHLDILLQADSFEAIDGDYPGFGSGSADVVVGNPPWRRGMSKSIEWCKDLEYPVGDGEQSQAFIHLTGELLKKGGRAGLLVSSGVLFNRRPNSRKFREKWLKSGRLKHVVNFAHVRHVFFSGKKRQSRGTAPFISVVFTKEKPQSRPNDQFEYWSAKRTMTVENTRSIVLNRGDMHWLSQQDCLAYEKLWKIYWWGGHRDEALVRKLEMNPQLSDLQKQIEGTELQFGRGFDSSSKQYASEWLNEYKALPSTQLIKYGHQPLNDLATTPDRVNRRGKQEIYRGHRLLVARGIRGDGHIIARFDTETEYCFRDSIHGVRFYGFAGWQEATVTAIFWSSLARYYYFTTSGSWVWHDSIELKEDVKGMPIRFPEDGRLRGRIVSIVKKLQQLGVDQSGFNDQVRSDLEQKLDEAVFDLYQLNTAERDLVREMCSVGLPMFYQRQGKEVESVQCPNIDTGKLSDVSGVESGLPAYLRIFLENWNREVSPDGAFVWRVIKPSLQIPLLAVSFTVTNGQEPTSNGNNASAWSNLLHRLSDSAIVPAGGSRIFLDTFFRYVGENKIIFIKRNEKRFWTRTAAREDVESVLTHLMNRELQS